MESKYDLVDLEQWDPELVISLPYATKDNVTGQPIYPANAKAYLRRPVAKALKKAHEMLLTKGFRIKVWDAYRPFSCQELLWQAFPDDRYVKQPKRDGETLLEGSVHGRGAAVDITLVDSETLEELSMPTGFDDFTEKAHRDNTDLPPEVLKRTIYLDQVMHRFGFIGLSTEWWHFGWHDEKIFALLDTPIAE